MTQIEQEHDAAVERARVHEATKHCLADPHFHTVINSLAKGELKLVVDLGAEAGTASPQRMIAAMARANATGRIIEALRNNVSVYEEVLAQKHRAKSS